MSVVIETTLGDITVDLFLTERPRACLNFLKLCKIKYYNYNLFHTISRGFIAQTGDPTGSRSGGESIFGVLDGSSKRFFEGENEPRIKHTRMGLISFVGNEERMLGSQFFLTLGEDLTYLDEKHCVFGEVMEGFDILEIINEVICDTDDRPYQDVRITHTVVLDDPYPDPKRLIVPSRSPSPNVERLQGGRIAPDEEIDEMEGRSAGEIAEVQADREAKARATILEMVGDLPDAEMAPPENVLFVCKLNPVTNDDDLEIIFSRFGKIKSCEVIRDKKTGDSLQYAFVEFEDQKACEDAYFKMDNVLIDDRRIHVDFSQSVSKVKWHGKGRGVTHYDEKGNKTRNNKDDIGKGNYKHKKNNNNKSESGKDRKSTEHSRGRSRSPNNSRRDLRSRSPRSDMNKLTNKRNISLSPKRKRDPISPNRSEVRNSRSHRYSKENEKSKKNKDRSLSPKRRSRSPSHRKSKDNSRRNISYSPKSEQHGSKNYKDIKEKHRNKSKSPRRSSDRKNREYYNEGRKYVAAKSEKNSSGRKTNHSPKRKVENRRDRSVSREGNKLRYRKRSNSTSETEIRKGKAKKKRYSESSDSDTDKKSKAKIHGSDSSESDDNKKQKLKKRKDSKTSNPKNKYDSSSDSDHDYKRKKLGKKSRKKKKKYESDSD